MPEARDSSRPGQARSHRSALVGIGLSLATLPIHLLLDYERSVDFSAVVVAVIGAIYVGFALQSGSVKQIIAEAVVACAFIGIAFAGMWWSPWIIPLGYVAHGIWDTIHHRSHAVVTVPRWYPPFCAAYDWLYAAGLTFLWLHLVPA